MGTSWCDMLLGRERDERVHEGAGREVGREGEVLIQLVFCPPVLGAWENA